MIQSRFAFLVAFTLVLLACASGAQRRQMEEVELAVYSKHAGEPIDQIRSFRFISWQPVSDNTLLLEARLNDWYLITVSGPCMNLPFAHTIAFETHINTLQARFDSIRVEGEPVPCRIETIRPVDVKAVKAELKQRQAVAE